MVSNPEGFVEERDADLSGTNFSHANLSDADLSGANLSSADLIDANLSHAILIEVKNIIPSQIKFTLDWNQAIYEGHWDKHKSKWIIDDQANQEYIEKLQNTIY